MDFNNRIRASLQCMLKNPSITTTILENYGGKALKCYKIKLNLTLKCYPELECTFRPLVVFQEDIRSTHSRFPNLSSRLGRMGTPQDTLQVNSKN